MDIRELRLGNMVHTPDTNQDVPVCALNTFTNCLYVNNNIIAPIYANEVEPIVLTEELLLKCGFYQIYGSDPQEPNAMLLYYNSTGDFTIMSTENDRDTFLYDTGIIVTSVHQLQNLHFALTGKELEVTL